jgi:hypothetical protein
MSSFSFVIGKVVAAISGVTPEVILAPVVTGVVVRRAGIVIVMVVSILSRILVILLVIRAFHYLSQIIN